MVQAINDAKYCGVKWVETCIMWTDWRVTVTERHSLMTSGMTDV